MIRIVISQRVDYWGDRNETRDALDQNLVNWLMEAGYIPFPIPNSMALDTFNHWIRSISPGGTTVGGNDIGSVATRDNTEYRLLEYCKENTVPVLGICRGMQYMITHAGGNLIALEGHVATYHKLKENKSEEVSFPNKVNSYHGFGVINNLPDDYDILAVSEMDNSIEAITHKTLPWEGWMWHPEREDNFCPLQIKRLQALFGV